MRPSLWGLNIAVAASMPSGIFLCGQFATGAAIYDREANVLEVSREHADFFTKNLLAILCETRLTVAVYQPTAFIYGSTSGGAVIGS
jgi:HK97 family phage major capsid protein